MPTLTLTPTGSAPKAIYSPPSGFGGHKYYIFDKNSFLAGGAFLNALSILEDTDVHTLEGSRLLLI